MASGLVVAFVAITPGLITLVSLPFGIKPSRLEIAGIAIGFAGVVLLVRGAGFSASTAGLTSVFASTISWSLGSVLSQHRFRLAPESVGFASEMICGGIFLMALSELTGERFHWPFQPFAVAAWLYLVALGSLIAFSAYMILLSHTTAALATSYSFVNPVIAVLLGVGFAGESVTPYEWLAVGIIILGVVLLVIGRRSV